ncbi:global transcription factor [Cucumis melo var. makuwa]|uniref:Global transcription factor n=1 Tax=Cucumis melo var. makuwa TaxID=1194695 RepID=A0A5D3BMS5_CUCMM|nr:global transcription factor [Cucumis melo var. makuwa]
MYCVGKASPDRLYRATLLRNRFADTILKAREKAFEKKISRCTTYGVGKPRPFPTHYLPFPTHIYGVGKTKALGIPLIFHVRLFPTHYLWRRENLGLSRRTTFFSRCTLTPSGIPKPFPDALGRRREYPLFPDVLWPTHELCFPDAEAKHVMFLKLESWKKSCIFKGASIFEGVLEVGDLEESLYLQRSFNLRSWRLGRKLVSSKELQSSKVFLKLETWKKACIFKEFQSLRVFLKLETWKKACIFKGASIFEGASIFKGVLEVGDLEESLYLQRSFRVEESSISWENSLYTLWSQKIFPP